MNEPRRSPLFSRFTISRLHAVLAVLALAGAGGLLGPSCSHDSYLVVVMRSTGAQLTGIKTVTVVVTDATPGGQGTPMVTRTFDIASDAGLAIDMLAGKSFSLSFTPERSGPVDVSVTVSDSQTCMASGMQKAVAIKKGGNATATIALMPSSGCPGADAGADDGGLKFVGCDPAAPTACPTSQTCYVDCKDQVGVCIAGGAKRAGEACDSNSDCMPGTQCFDYGCGTPSKYCLKFCNGDADCAGSTSVTSTSLCSDPVVCPPTTAYKTCGFTCDPRGAGTQGCPAGLFCFLFKSSTGGQDTPACGCTKDTRTGTDGMKCTVADDCAPGFLCDQMAGGTVCRRICQMSSPTDCPTGQSCLALQNNTVFGVCL